MVPPLSPKKTDKSGKNANEAVSAKKQRKPRKAPAVAWKKPKDMPKRPLSAYNFFFKEQREEIMSVRAQACEEELKKRSKKETVGIGFANLARTIADKWQAMDANNKTPYLEQASKEKARYNKEMLVWRAKQKKEKEISEALIAASSNSLNASGNLNTMSHPHQGLDINRSLNRPMLEESLSRNSVAAGLSASFLPLHQGHMRADQSQFFHHSFSDPSMLQAQTQHHERQLYPRAFSSPPFYDRQQLQQPAFTTLQHQEQQQQQEHRRRHSSSFPEAWFQLQKSSQEGSNDPTRNSPVNDTGGELTMKVTPTSRWASSEGESLKKTPPAEAVAAVHVNKPFVENAAYGSDPHPLDASNGVNNLSALASKLDNDTIRFLTEFRFSNGSGEGDEEPK